MPAPKCIASLYDVSRRGRRPQTVLTPYPIIDAMQRLWPDGIALDPCAPPGNAGSLVGAARWCDGDNADGLAVDWVDRTFVNPPYDSLAEWIDKAISTNVELVMLVPVRTHRKYFQLDRFDEVRFLPSMSFHRYVDQAPFPLCLLYRGVCDFRWATEELGGVWVRLRHNLDHQSMEGV